MLAAACAAYWSGARTNINLWFSELKPYYHDVNTLMMSEKYFDTHIYHNYALKQPNHPFQVARSHDALVANRSILNIKGRVTRRHSVLYPFDSQQSFIYQHIIDKKIISLRVRI